MFRVLVSAIALGFAVVSAAAQAAPARTHAAELSSVRVTPGEFGPVIQVASTRPITPKIQVVENPLRLVIDLPNSLIGSVRNRIYFRNEQIKAIRVNQFQSSPAVARIVLDLAAPVLYTWDASGNHLRIRVRADEAATAKPPSVPAFTAGVQPAAVPVAVGTSGSVVETGSRVASGSSVTAGDEVAILRLTRGGEVRVCPGTSVSVSTSSNGHDMMLGMSKGSLETHYGVQESVDSVLTPDFRIVLPGPGEFNLAVTADAHGNTCIASLPGSTSSAVVAELLGSGTYEIKPEQQAFFRQGRLDSVETPVAPCGCPAAPEPVLRTENKPSQPIAEKDAGDKVQLASQSEKAVPEGKPTDSALPDPGPAASPGQSVEAPLVFSGEEIAKARQRAAAKKIPAAPVAEAAQLPLAQPAQEPLPGEVVLPPPETKKSKGFFGKVKGFFGSIFH